MATDFLETELTNSTQTRYQDQHLEVDLVDKFAILDSERLTLTRKEFALLAHLVENAGEIVPRGMLLEQIWGYSTEIHTRTLDVHIRRLRKRLGVYSKHYIETVFGVGYRFQPFREVQNFRPTLLAVASLCCAAGS